MPQKDEAETPRLGRRIGPSTTRANVLHAAQERFARNGFEGTSIRKVAADAGVDPALVMQFFKSKDGLFAASLTLSDEVQDHITAAFDAPRDQLGQSLATAFLNLWEDSPDRPPLMAAMRGAASNAYAAEQLGQFVQNRLIQVIGPKVGAGPEAAQRAGLVLSMLMGLVLTRNMVVVPLVAKMSRVEIAQIVGQPIQLLLD